MMPLPDISPDGSRVVYEWGGEIYVTTLPARREML